MLFKAATFLLGAMVLCVIALLHALPFRYSSASIERGALLVFAHSLTAGLTVSGMSHFPRCLPFLSMFGAVLFLAGAVAWLEGGPLASAGVLFLGVNILGSVFAYLAFKGLIVTFRLGWSPSAGVLVPSVPNDYSVV